MILANTFQANNEAIPPKFAHIVMSPCFGCGIMQFRVVSVFYFSFILQVRASETNLKQTCFISFLFQFYFSFISDISA